MKLIWISADEHAARTYLLVDDLGFLLQPLLVEPLVHQSPIGTQTLGIVAGSRRYCWYMRILLYQRAAR